MCKQKRECPIVWGAGRSSHAEACSVRRVRDSVQAGAKGLINETSVSSTATPGRECAGTQEKLTLCVKGSGSRGRGCLNISLGRKWLACSMASGVVPLGEILLNPDPKTYLTLNPPPAVHLIPTACRLCEP